MKAEEIRKFQREMVDEQLAPWSLEKFWLVEIAAQLAELNESQAQPTRRRASGIRDTEAWKKPLTNPLFHNAIH